jgi:fructan beta-fructosidase
MNNWKYAGDLPTAPWRGAMTLPRRLTLRQYPDGIRLVQRPVAALRALRTKPKQLSNLTVNDRYVLPTRGQTVEIIAKIDGGRASSFGLKVAKGPQHETVIGYDMTSKSLFIDRTRSGKVDFQKDFPGKYAAALPLEGNTLTLHIFLDKSSVEVFANDGRCVLTCLLFPDAQDSGLELYSQGGKVKVQSLRTWTLQSVW